MAHRVSKPLYKLYGIPVPRPDTLDADSILSVFPPPGLGRGKARAQTRNNLALGASRVDEWTPSISNAAPPLSREKDIAPERESHVSGQFDDVVPAAAKRGPRIAVAVSQNQRRKVENGPIMKQWSHPQPATRTNAQPAGLNVADMLAQDPGEDEVDDESD